MYMCAVTALFSSSSFFFYGLQELVEHFAVYLCTQSDTMKTLSKCAQIHTVISGLITHNEKVSTEKHHCISYIC